MRRVTSSSIVALSLAFGASTPVAGALPVPIGVQGEIRYGISPDHPWATADGERGRSGASRFRVPSRAPRRVFEINVGAGRIWAPAFDREGRLYISMGAGLVGLDTSGGRRFMLPLGLVGGTASITPRGDVVVVARGTELVRVTPAGEVEARALVSAGLLGSPLVLDDGSVVVVDRAGRLVRLDSALARLAARDLGERVRTALALTPGHRVLVAQGLTLTLFDPLLRPGASARLDSPVVAGPALARDGRVWVITADATLVSLDADLRVQSRSSLGGSRLASPSLAVAMDGSVRVSSLSAGLSSYSAAGELIFQRSELRVARGATVDAEGTLVAVDESRQLVAVTADGEVRFRVPVGLLPWAAPVLGPGGTLYLVGRRGTLAAWR